MVRAPGKALTKICTPHWAAPGPPEPNSGCCACACCWLGRTDHWAASTSCMQALIPRCVAFNNLGTSSLFHRHQPTPTRATCSGSSRSSTPDTHLDDLYSQLLVASYHPLDPFEALSLSPVLGAVLVVAFIPPCSTFQPALAAVASHDATCFVSCLGHALALILYRCCYTQI